MMDLQSFPCEDATVVLSALLGFCSCKYTIVLIFAHILSYYLLMFLKARDFLSFPGHSKTIIQSAVLIRAEGSLNIFN